MRLLLLLFTFLITTSITFGQHYKTVYPSQSVNFTYEENALPLYIDSTITLPTEDIYLPASYYNIYTDKSSCIDLSETTWVGDQIIIRQNGLEIYFNELGDSIFLYPRKEVGESWAMTNLKDGYFLEATVTQKELATFVGLTDSVKTITIQAKNNLNNPIAHVLNQKTLQISQHHGWVKGRDFRTIPHALGYRTDTVAFRMIGKNDGQTGVYNIGFDEIFNFEVGDVFHVYHGSVRFSGDGTRKYIKKRVIEKTATANVFSYKIIWERLHVGVSYDYDTNTYDTTTASFIDTFTRNYYRINYDYLDTLPMQFGSPYTSTFFQAMVRKFANLYHGDEMRQMAKYVGTFVVVNSDSTNCWTEQGEECEEGVYYEGLGGPYASCGVAGIRGSIEILYYNKGGIEWGDSINFDALKPKGTTNNNQVNPPDTSFQVPPDTLNPISFKIYPNPASNILTVETPKEFSDATINIRNALGQVIMTVQNLNTKEVINIIGLSNGVYFVSLESGGAFYIEELVIRK